MEKTEFVNTVMPFKDKLYRIAKRILISEDEAEDAVQEVYVRLWNSRENLKTYRSPEAFAVTITKNFCLDRLKSKQAGNLKIVHNNYETSDSIERNVEAKEGVSLVLKIMESLPTQQRMVLQLRDIEQYEFSEIAKMLESNETAIRVTLSRARKAVRDQMIKQYNYGVN